MLNLDEIIGRSAGFTFLFPERELFEIGFGILVAAGYDQTSVHPRVIFIIILGARNRRINRFLVGFGFIVHGDHVRLTDAERQRERDPEHAELTVAVVLPAAASAVVAAVITAAAPVVAAVIAASAVIVIRRGIIGHPHLTGTLFVVVNVFIILGRGAEQSAVTGHSPVVALEGLQFLEIDGVFPVCVRDLRFADPAAVAAVAGQEPPSAEDHAGKQHQPDNEFQQQMPDCPELRRGCSERRRLR